MLQLEWSVRVSQRPAMVLPSSLDVPVKRCEASIVVKSGVSLTSVQMPSLKVIVCSHTTPRESK
jgi:hypothetical protein